MLGRRGDNRTSDARQLGMHCCQVDLLLCGRRADVTGDVEVEVVLLDLRHLHPAGVAGLFLAVLVGVDDLVDVLRLELVLAFALLEVLGGVDEEYVVRVLVLLEHEDADRNARRVEEFGGQADDGVEASGSTDALPCGAVAFSTPFKWGGGALMARRRGHA